jgi:site-specific DNA recombinase
MEKATIYARVSTKEQAEEGYSLASQLKLLREYAAHHQFDVVKELVVPESASGRQERTTFKEMMDYCRKHGISHILCEKVDRITRNLQDAVWIDSWLQGDLQRRVHFVKQNLVIHQNAKSYEKFQWDIYVVLARQYSNNLSEETKKGLVEKAQEGWYPGSAKRGYISVGERGHKLWEIDRSENSEAWFIARAFEMYAAGNHTLGTIRDTLFEQGWATSRGKKVAKGIIHTILKDPFYCGKFIWNGQEYEGKHEPLVAEERFEIVQRKLKRVLKNGKTRKHSFLYAGLFHCAGCGSSVSAELQKGHVYYRCTRYKPCAQKKTTREESITSQITNALEALKIPWPQVVGTLRRILKESHEAEKSYHESVMKELSDQLNRIKARIDVLYDDRADRHITKEFFDEKLTQYEKQQKQVIRKIDRHKERAISYAKTASDILHTSQRAKELFEQLNPEDKRDLFRFILAEPRLDNGKLVFGYRKPFDKVHEIATFQPQKSKMKQGQIRDLLPFYPDLLRQQDDFPTHLSSESIANFLQAFFGVLEFPTTFKETAEYFAKKSRENYSESLAA